MAKKKNLDLMKDYGFQNGESRKDGHKKFTKYKVFRESASGRNDKLETIGDRLPNRANDKGKAPKTSQKGAGRPQSVKSNRMNMAFTAQNYQKILDKADAGIAAAHFVNAVVQGADLKRLADYVGQNPLRRCNATRRKGNKSHRVYIRFDPENYEKATSAAHENGVTITQAVNMMLELAGE